MRHSLLAALLAGGLAVSAAAAAQPANVHKTTLQTQDFPPPNLHTVTIRTAVDPGKIVARHTHPGVEMAYIVSGDALVKIAGRPDQTLHAGGSFSVPPQTPHSVQNTSAAVLVIISTYVVEKAKPIASPTP